ncbi:hypothetical protein AGMMS49944_27370 [Spirochaetia bacterium]|nr:hypothetical protein AGMMS49944_27370 [Spirochaetia bacterium]
MGHRPLAAGYDNHPSPAVLPQGDKRYGAKTDPLSRLCLHAERIVFHHPHDGRVMEFTVKAPRWI